MVPFTVSEPKPGILSIGGDLSLAAAPAFAELLFSSLDAHAALHVDLLNVTEADISTLQIMLVAVREAQRQGKELRWLGYGLCVEDLVNLVDLNHDLGGPLAVVWE